MSSHIVKAASMLAVVGALAASMPVLANEWSANVTTVGVDGVKGTQGIRTDPGHVVDVGMAHPVQIDIGASGGDFVAVGTYKSAGTSMGGADCPNDYDPSWTGYVDGEVGGIYFCYPFGADQYDAGEVSSFEISYKACGVDGVKKWTLSYGGTLRRCVASASTTGSIGVVGLETFGSSVDRNIDVRYAGLSINRNNANEWVSGTWEIGRTDPSYNARINSNTQNDCYLAPWN